jgi:uncharacterized phage-like protein YoqJ
MLFPSSGNLDDLFETEQSRLSGTGHRPHKLGGYSTEIFGLLQQFLRGHIERIRPSRILSGMAVGFDQALACASLDLGIPYDSIVPFEGQEKRWPSASRRQYCRLLERAAKVVIVSSGGFAPEKMRIRNRYLVDHCDLLIALWDGTSSGTGDCVGYAQKVGRPFENLWAEWTQVQADGIVRVDSPSAASTPK